jgi:PKD repeat protein
MTDHRRQAVIDVRLGGAPLTVSFTDESTVPATSVLWDFGDGGTSAATPHVAGAFAVLRSKVPSATVSQIIEALRATGKPVRDFRTGLTTPRIDVARALDYLQGNITATAAINYMPTGDGSGTVSFAPTGSLNSCAANCTNSYPAGSMVMITAQPNPGMQFLGWNGACKGSDIACTITVGNSMTQIGASFGRATAPSPSVTLNYLKTGSGTISATVNGSTTTCAASCTITRPAGTQVTLTAQPGPNAVFTGWGGSCRGTVPTCTVTLTATSVALATFQTRPRNLASSK